MKSCFNVISNSDVCHTRFPFTSKKLHCSVYCFLRISCDVMGLGVGGGGGGGSLVISNT